MTKRRQITVCAVIISLLIICIFSRFLIGNFKNEAMTAQIIVNGETRHIINLRDYVGENNLMLDIDGKNAILIENAQIRVVSASCPDKICVSQGARGANCSNFSPVICLPNKLTIIVHSKDSNADAYSQ